MPAQGARLPPCAAGRKVYLPTPAIFTPLSAQETFRVVLYLKVPTVNIQSLYLSFFLTGGTEAEGVKQWRITSLPSDALDATCADIESKPFVTYAGSSRVANPAQIIFIDVKNAASNGSPSAFTVTIQFQPTAKELEFFSSLASLLEDPHITTWNGVTQTVFTEGDFLLVESSGTGLALHSRHCKAATGHWAPWTCEVALRCDDSSEAIEISAAQWGTATGVVATGMAVEELPGDVRKVTCSSGLTMLVKRQRFHRHAYLNVHLSVNFPAALDARGLLGTPNGDASNDLRSRSGEVLKEKLVQGRHGKKHYIGHALEELDAIHESWRVRDSEKLFKRDMLPTTSSGIRATVARGMVVPSITTEVAKTKCRDAGLEAEVDVAICVHDLIMVRHVDGGNNLAQFNEAVAKHM